MNQDKREIINGREYINGHLILNCCDKTNPIVKGYVWSKWLFPVRGCGNCGMTHYMFGLKRMSLFLFLGERLKGIKEILEVKFPEIKNYHRCVFKKKHGEITEENTQPLWKIVFEVITKYYFPKLKKIFIA